MYVDDFVAAAHWLPDSSSEIDNQQQVRRLLLHVVDDVFHSLLVEDGPEWRKPVSLKKLHAGDCLWGTMELVLG
jgi:hypothetical protein